MGVDVKNIAVNDTMIERDEYCRYFDLDGDGNLTAEGRAQFEKWRSMGDAQDNYRRKFGFGWSDSNDVKPLPDGVKCVAHRNDDPASFYVWGYIDERPESETFTNVHDYGLWSMLAQNARMEGLLG